MSTSKKAKSNGRLDIRIPEKSKIYEFLDVDNTIINIPIWKRLDAILALAEINRDVEAIRIYDEFVKRISVYYPDKVNELDNLRPLFLKRILRGHKLDTLYCEEIREKYL